MTQFYRSYLFAYLVYLGVALGCLGMLQLHSLTGGNWGKASRRVLQAGADTLPWLGLLLLPVLIGLRHIYPWANLAHLAAETKTLAHLRIYFGLPFFLVRALFYFFIWTWMASRQRRGTAGSALDLVFYTLTVSFASFDWVMSLEAPWTSSIYGAMLLVGNGVAALAFAIVVLYWQTSQGKVAVPEDTAHDLGNLLLAFVMMWTYMALSQYLIIWSANLPEEIGWYLARQRGGWQAVAILLILLQFTLPFFLLLARQRKRKLERLVRVALLILIMRVVDIFWLTAPDFSPGAFSIHFFDFLTLILVGGAWLYGFSRQFPLKVAA